MLDEQMEVLKELIDEHKEESKTLRNLVIAGGVAVVGVAFIRNKFRKAAEAKLNKKLKEDQKLSI